MNRTAVYPGTFDPVTYGHLDVIKRVSSLYDIIYVAVAGSNLKAPVFTSDERVKMLEEAASGYDNVKVESFDGLVVDYARSRQAKVMIRGLRMISDFEYEFQMALTNRKLAPDIETVFMMPNETYSYLSSKLIKEIALTGADISEFVPGNVEEKLKEKMAR